MLVVLKQKTLSYDASRLFASALFGKRFALHLGGAKLPLCPDLPAGERSDDGGCDEREAGLSRRLFLRKNGRCGSNALPVRVGKSLRPTASPVKMIPD